VNAAHLDEVDSGEESNFDLGVASMKPEALKSDDKTPAVSISATTLALGKDKGKKKAAAKKPKADLSTSATASSETDRRIAQLECINLELLAQLKASQDSDSESIFSRSAGLSKTAKPLDF
jgi:hypothetical protein